MGHNLGMRHDFENETAGVDRYCTTDGSSCTDDSGVMDYFQVSLFQIFFFLEYAFFNIQGAPALLKFWVFEKITVRNVCASGVVLN